MPRGFRKDIPATEKAYRTGLLIDIKKRSFISQPKAIPGECDEPKPHLLLYGADKTMARMRLFKREKSRCQACGNLVAWGGEDPLAQPGYVGEWHHLRNKLWNRCDCLENAELFCGFCHQGPGSEHYKRRPRFGPEKVPA